VACWLDRAPATVVHPGAGRARPEVGGLLAGKAGAGLTGLFLARPPGDW